MSTPGPVRVADLFCGAGGATAGVYRAARELGVPLGVIAVNHWPTAIETHAANYPDATHLCMSVESVDPRQVVPSGRLHLLIAGVECTHHSNARGGRPMNDQSRASAWNVLRWCELLRVDHVLIENVVEFQTWGPLDAKMRPVKARKGETYRAFLAALESLGYRVEARALNAADYGDATTRLRLFIQATRGRAIAWPEPTHAKRHGASLIRTTAPWRAAREVIDWSLPSQAISERKKPLSANTMRRIEAGLRRFGARPFVLQQQSGGIARDTADPVPTIATKGAVSLVEPFLICIDHKGGRGALRGVDEPLVTMTTKARHAVVEPFLVPFRGERKGQQPRTHAISEPLPTVTAGANGFGLCEPFTMPYCSNGAALARPVSEPVGTVTTRDRLALVIPDGMDVRFRMLQPHELAAAMGFPAGYQFAGTKTDIVRQIGNAWACRTATALCRVILAQHAPARGAAPTGAIVVDGKVA